MHIATNSSRINISEENSVKSIANLFAKNLNHTAVFLLYGEVGVGKTTFVKHFINCLQSINKEQTTEVPSPTFNIVNEYKINEIIVNHYDLFKIKNSKELYNIGIFEDNSELVTLVEWPEIISKKPKKIIELYFNYEDDFKKRNLKIFSDHRKEIINEFK